MKDHEWESLLNNPLFKSLMRKVFSARVASGEDFGSDEWLLRETHAGEHSWLWQEAEKINAQESQNPLKVRFPGIDACAIAIMFMRHRKRTYKEASKGKPLSKPPTPLFSK